MSYFFKVCPRPSPHTPSSHQMGPWPQLAGPLMGAFVEHRLVCCSLSRASLSVALKSRELGASSSEDVHASCWWWLYHKRWWSRNMFQMLWEKRALTHTRREELWAGTETKVQGSKIKQDFLLITHVKTALCVLVSLCVHVQTEGM